MQFYISLLSLVLFTFPCFGFSALPFPYAYINVLPEDNFGWYAQSNAQEIERLIAKYDVKTVVEIGSWVGGGSTRHIGNILKKKQGKLYAVDTWLGSEEHQEGQSCYMPILSYVYQQFLSNMIHWDLTDVVIPCRMKSLEAAKALNVKPDLVYVDGEHSTKAVYEDLVAWYPLLGTGGIICGDDWGCFPSVRVAVEKFASEKGFVIYINDNFWMLGNHQTSFETKQRLEDRDFCSG